jgi:hypothetical protein
MPLDTRAYDTYTEIPDSLESSNIYNLIGINSICSSEQPNACFRSSSAHNTRVEMGGRPRVVSFGKRWANEPSTAATRAAHGNISAYWRRGCVSGTKSATWRHGPCPVSQCWRSRKSFIVGSPDRGRKRASAYDDPIPRTIPSWGE